MADIQTSSDHQGKCSHVDDLIKVLHTTYKLLKVHSSIPYAQFSSASSASRNTAAKSTARAIEYKNLGNQSFGSGLHSEASYLFTKSLAYAEEVSEEAAYACGNRSAALFKLGKYEQSIVDIDRAISGKYPEDKKEKLRARKERCLIELERVREVRKLRNASKSDGQNQLFESTKSEEVDAKWHSLCDFKNTLLPSTSIKVKLGCNEQWGRFMIAVEDIEPGEILCCEKFFSLKVESQVKYSYCACCLSQCYTLIPCSSCRRAMYCSLSCRTRAFNMYHRVECKILRSRKIYDELDEEDRMALRMLLIGTEQGAGLKTLMKKMTVQDIFAEMTDPTNKPFANDYLSALKLRWTFFKPLSRNYTDKLRPVAEIIVALRDSGYFENDQEAVQQAAGGSISQKIDEGLNESELFTALLLFNHIISVRANIFSVEHLQNSAYGYASRIGSGICILQNMINHSCDPSAASFVRGQEQVLFAVRPIPKGEQIFISYTGTFVTSPARERVKMLSNPNGNYRFYCCCKACTNQWPTDTLLQKRKIKFLSENVETLIDDLCEIMVPVAKNGMDKFSDGEILQRICQIRKWLHINVEQPSMVIANCENLLVRVMKYFYGNLLPENMTEARKRIEIELLIKDIMHTIMYEVDWLG